MNQRPLAVTIVAWVYIGVGAAGFVTGFHPAQLFLPDNVLVELVRLLAVVAGVFMLRGQNWARWLALAWMISHVILSAFGSVRELAIHCLFCAAVIWVLWRPGVVRYFRRAATQSTEQSRR